MNIYQRPSEAAVRSLLIGADLPTSDLTENMENFFGCGSPDSPGGIIGLELFGTHALLRSLAVDPAFRGKGCGRALVSAAECHAKNTSVRRVFLLTETAKDFFRSLGYNVTPREMAPESIQNTTEFSSICPASAIFMSKSIG